MSCNKVKIIKLKTLILLLMTEEEKKILYKNFDWESYLRNFPRLRETCNTKDKCWHHYINIGSKKGLTYFDINDREKRINEYTNFDWEMYINFYENLKGNFKDKDTAWWHYNNIGRKIGNKYFNIEDRYCNKKNIFYYVGKTSKQDFNTGIQRVTRNLSNLIGNYFNEYNIFLVTYDAEEDLRLLNEDELSIFCKYNGYNHLENIYFKKKDSLFKKIKEGDSKVQLFIPELFEIDNFNIFENIIEKFKKNKWQTIHIYYDDTIYNNDEIEETYRKKKFNFYIKILSKIDVILPISDYSKCTYLFHKNRLGFETNQIIEPILLSGELLNNKRIFHKEDCQYYVFANISVTKRKNAGSLIKAFNLLVKDFPNLKLIICGVVYANTEYYDLFKTDLNNNIIFVQNKSDEEIGKFYRNSLFSIYPSIEEGFGIPIYESLWNCTPVICHNATSTLEISNNINLPCVACINCLNVNDLYLQMKEWMNKENFKNICNEIKKVKIKSWYEYADEIIKIIEKGFVSLEKIPKIIYYYADYIINNTSRTGIQVCTINLAKKFIKKNINIVFVKWDKNTEALVPCNYLEMNHFFNFNEAPQIIKNENEEILKKIKYYYSYKPIHLTNNNMDESLFFCPELVVDNIEKLSNYLKKIKLFEKSTFILYDIIPLVVKDYMGLDFFYKYLKNIILYSNKIITISDFTKTEFIDYCKKNNLFDYNNFSITKSILLPYQYRNKPRILNNEITNDKITILLPGTLEPRKQQLLFIEIFYKFIELNPEIDVELVIFGEVWNIYIEIMNIMINKSKNKIKYLGRISNEHLFELYKNASFSCFISYYEGFGFPISESLWHSTPVLTANFGSMREVAKLGGCYCVDTTNKTEIYQALDVLVKNPEILINLRKEINNANLKTWENYADEIYNELIKI
jgi:glycosyltransferase involved in cell wall biosynthesis